MFEFLTELVRFAKLVYVTERAPRLSPEALQKANQEADEIVRKRFGTKAD